MAEGNVYKMKFFENWGFVVYGSDKLFLLTNPRQYKEDCLYDLVPILGEDIKIAKKPLTPDSKCTIEGEVYDLKLIDMRIFAISSAGDGKKSTYAHPGAF